MRLIIDGIVEGLRLLASLDREVLRITWLTLRVSGTATVIAVLAGVPLGTWLGLARFRGRGTLITIVNVGMGLPPVIAGLLVSILLWRSGPLGALRLLYTPTAMIIAQGLIASPLVIGLTRSAIESLDTGLQEQLLSLGASRRQMLWSLLGECRLGLMAAVIAGFGGVVSEVGASIMVGGNIPGHTRVLTTAIVLEVSRGQFGAAIALSTVLMVLAYLTTAILTGLQQKGSRA
ncbi:MAG: ABC transporter permease [Bacillota bacterium]|nr:ABC transporter permease [Bacillota bacterium]